MKPHYKHKKMILPGLLFGLILFSIFLSSAGLAAAETKSVSEILTGPTGKWTGDLKGMIDRRVIRVLVTYSKTNFFVDRVHPRGITYEVFKEFEKALNKKLKRKHLKIHVLFQPVSRDELIPFLLQGKGDIAAASLTITPERLKSVDFTMPSVKNVKELVISGPEVKTPESLEDLSGKTIHVRGSSSYFESLTELNARLAEQGKKPVIIKEVNENLETEDILEMVNAGLFSMTVADDHIAKLWLQVFSELKMDPQVAIKSGSEIGWAFRKNSPELAHELNDFIKSRKKGTLYGNIIFNRYYKSTKFIKNSLTEVELKRFKQAVEFFRKYGDKYGFDWLMIAALAYQESGIDQSKRSHVGAVGVMQILPSTAADPSINIPDIEEIESNIHSGVKYLHWIYNRYFKNEDMAPLDKILLSFASYNAGPARVRQLRARATKMGLDPNRWFANVEVAAAKVIGRETVQYVSNIFKYYLAYRVMAEKMIKSGQIKKEAAAKAEPTS